ncbi:MAG: 16S rRNA (cytidine(1402)-2'-O)-methyltransferase [Deltaproteobacteria bacterium]|nr:16S rRNA (cytidine(1402)-2'-O)-methyltransferase [Deltaproteobacteria bacterium]
MSGILYIVATPIGNLEDITLRALKVLKEADAIITEDTRHSRGLLAHFGVQKKLVSYFEYSKQQKAEAIISHLEAGENLALITDAGTPAVSDPGARLVALARSRGIDVVPIPGPSAATAALSVCGFPTDPFHFWGFLPPSNNKRRKIYEAIALLPGTHCFYESPHKILKRVDEWGNYFSEFYLMIGRELTKKFETILWGKFPEVAERLKQSEARGEYTIVLSREKLV